jgi:hypothetical protein
MTKYTLKTLFLSFSVLGTAAARQKSDQKINVNQKISSPLSRQGQPLMACLHKNTNFLLYDQIWVTQAN